VVGDNWTLAIVTELAAGRIRLSALRECLAGVSAGVLDRYLQQMSEAGLVRRFRYREMPPRVEVELTDAGRELLPIAAALSRWGLRWAWSEPLGNEIVDPSALLRALPWLLDGPLSAPDGAVELIFDGRGGRRRHLAEISGGEVTMWSGDDSRIAPEVTATILGDWRAWTAALGPGADVSALQLAGRTKQAKRLLAALVRPRAAPASAEAAAVGDTGSRA
jgi:DNA-binding HxlR family transcriptional regulator